MSNAAWKKVSVRRKYTKVYFFNSLSWPQFAKPQKLNETFSVNALQKRSHLNGETTGFRSLPEKLK